ncbi:MAG: energy transducer TonB [Thermomonas sp.]
MKLIAIVAVLIALTACSKGQAVDCSPIDPHLVVCPNPKAPHVPDLTSGKVVVVLTIRLDGSVSDAKILSSSGNSAWEEPILSAVQRWRYEQSDHVVSKTVPFDMQYGK